MIDVMGDWLACYRAAIDALAAGCDHRIAAAKALDPREVLSYSDQIICRLACDAAVRDFAQDARRGRSFA